MKIISNLSIFFKLASLSRFCYYVIIFKNHWKLINYLPITSKGTSFSKSNLVCHNFRSYSRGAQGILLVYDITNRWSFEGIDRWVREVEEHAPGIPKVFILHWENCSIDMKHFYLIPTLNLCRFLSKFQNRITQQGSL